MFITTFYSFKGGVGRTMALVNVAHLLAATGSRVLVVDFDLEAPGLSSYEPYRTEAARAGVVEFVTQYVDTDQAPDAGEFIYEHSTGHNPIWIMPAGRYTEPQYPGLLNSINWNELYLDKQGFLFFEDLKRQWSALGFNYVLIDSRTGYSDVSGICTRQLPDAVVTMFVPTRQNLEGLEPLVRAMRKEGPPVRSGRIELIFCPSNVPSSDDQEKILAPLLADARRKLRIDKFGGLINHYDSLDVLNQGVISFEQPDTRLAKQYEELHRSIVALNLEDRNGALQALAQMGEAFDQARQANDAAMLQSIERRADRIRRAFSEDAEIAWSSARLANIMLRQDQELASLAVVIRYSYEEIRARLRRAAILSAKGDHPAALADVEWLFSNGKLTAFEVVPASEMLRSLKPEGWIEDVCEALASHRLDTVAAAALIQYSMVNSNVLPYLKLAAEQYSGIPNDSPEGRARIRNVYQLVLIAMQYFSDAMCLIGERARVLESGGVSEVFNYAVAEWGQLGSPPEDLFRRVLSLLTLPEGTGDTNLRQCLALCHMALGEFANALSEIRSARARLEFQRVSFSCWRYLNLEAAQMMEDLASMEKCAELGEVRPEVFQPKRANG